MSIFCAPYGYDVTKIPDYYEVIRFLAGHLLTTNDTIIGANLPNGWRWDTPYDSPEMVYYGHIILKPHPDAPKPKYGPEEVWFQYQFLIDNVYNFMKTGSPHVTRKEATELAMIENQTVDHVKRPHQNPPTEINEIMQQRFADAVTKLHNERKLVRPVDRIPLVAKFREGVHDLIEQGGGIAWQEDVDKLRLELDPGNELLFNGSSDFVDMQYEII